MRTKRYLKHYRCVTIVAIVISYTKTIRLLVTGKRFVSDSDKQYRYDTETMEFFLPGYYVIVVFIFFV